MVNSPRKLTLSKEEVLIYRKLLVNPIKSIVDNERGPPMFIEPTGIRHKPLEAATSIGGREIEKK
jgi:hypothetical protein